MGIRITQTYAKIGIDTVAADLNMKSHKPELEIHQNHARVKIRTELPRVEIDQYEAFASTGLKGPIDLTHEIAQRIYQQVIEQIGKIAEDGDTFAAIENGVDPIVSLAEEDPDAEHVFDVDCIPKVRPRITVKGSQQIEAGREGEGVHNGVEYSIIPGRVDYNFVPAQVNIYLRQYASVKFSYVEDSKIDIHI
ncbi:MAG TPA: DUF6470 family protein [Acetivibrio sp.]|jgi:hypothetical protein|nr:hypothetical protein [Clostridium sp.]HQA58850.1 DUF6470 family protein [Acetivibrio sp.]